MRPWGSCSQFSALQFIIRISTVTPYGQSSYVAGRCSKHFRCVDTESLRNCAMQRHCHPVHLTDEDTEVYSCSQGTRQHCVKSHVHNRCVLPPHPHNSMKSPQCPKKHGLESGPPNGMPMCARHNLATSGSLTSSPGIATEQHL